MIGAFIALLCDEARRLWYHKWLGLTVGLVTLCLGAAIVWNLPPVYDAWAQVFVNKQTKVAAAAQGVSLSDNYGAGLVARTLLNDQGLEQLARRMHTSSRPMSKRELGQTVGRLRRSIELAPDLGDGVFEFHVKDHDPVRAQRIAQQLLNDFVARNQDGSADELRQASAFLDSQISSYETMLADSRVRMAEFQQQHPRLTAAAPSAPMDVASAQLAYETASAQASSTTRPPSAADEKVNALQAKLATLRLEYTEDYPDVVVLKRQLALATAERDEQARTAPDRPRVSPALLFARRNLEAARRGAGGSAAPSPGLQSEWAEMQKNDEVLRGNYQELISRREAARMSQAASGADANRFQVLRRPTTPEVPIGPKRLLLLGGVVLAAVASGLGAAYLRAAIRGIFVSTRELEQIFELPVIGTVSWEPAWSTAAPGRSKISATLQRRLGRQRKRGVVVSRVRAP